MAMISPLSLESRSSLAPAAALFHSLGDQTRLAILRRLSEGEARVVDLVTELGLAQSTVSKHLACLRDCQLVSFRIVGRQSFSSLAAAASACPEQPHTAGSLHNLAGLLQAEGEVAAARSLFERALAIRERVLGSDHPDTASVRSNLSSLV